MSQLIATAPVGLRAPARERQAPRLHVVTGDAARRSGVGFVMACTALLVAAMMTLLVLNTKRAEASFAIHDLQASSGVLADTGNTLRAGLDLERSPAHLAARAAARGMVPSTSAAFIRLSDGKVLGVATKTKAQPDFRVIEQAAPRMAASTAGAVAPGMGEGMAAGASGPSAVAAKSTKAAKQTHTTHTTSTKSPTTKR